jgi:hypothetical protein
MAKKLLSGLHNRMKERTKRACGSLNRDARFLITLILFLGLGAGSIFMTISSIYNIGRKNAEKEFMDIEHIKRLELQQKDSLNTFKNLEYGTTGEFE